MSRSLVRRVGRLLSAVVLVAAGAYVFIYLVRWEWNRALIAGLFFLAAEVALASDVTLARVGDLGRRIEEERTREQTTALAARLRANRPDTPGPFAWLAPDRDRLDVFLPILIGAGVLLSAVAYVVEQLSRVTAVPVAEHELARGLSTMALPADGLAPLGRMPRPIPRATPDPTPGRAWRWITVGGLVALIAAAIVAGAQWLVSVPAAADPDHVLSVDVVVMRRDLEQPDRDIALALWSACQVRLPQAVELASVQPIGPAAADQLRLTLRPAPGHSDTREFVGCLQDTLIERARVDVLAATVSPQLGPLTSSAPHLERSAGSSTVNW